MKTYLKELKFPSTQHSYIKNITDELQRAVMKSKEKNGFIVVNSKHTTLGIIVNEISEPNLLGDFLEHTLHNVHEDKRSTRVQKEYTHPVKDYTHRCQDNPYCDEIDEDYNAAAHIRALSFSHASVIVPFQDGKLELGKYQEVAIFEFDGRDGKGKNPVRNRTVQIWVYPAPGIETIS